MLQTFLWFGSYFAFPNNFLITIWVLKVISRIRFIWNITCIFRVKSVKYFLSFFFIVPLFIEFSLNLVNTFFHFPSEFVFLFGKHWFFFSCFFQWTLKLKCLFLFNFFFCTLDSLSAQQEQGVLLDYCCFKAAERKSWPHFIICV